MPKLLLFNVPKLLCWIGVKRVADLAWPKTTNDYGRAKTSPQETGAGSKGPTKKWSNGRTDEEMDEKRTDDLINDFFKSYNIRPNF